jgi:hypothetical protein
VLRQPVSGGTWLGLVLCLLGGASLIGQSLEVAPERIRGISTGSAPPMFFGVYFSRSSGPATGAAPGG